MKTNDIFPMGRYEKIAWFNLAVVTLAVAIYAFTTTLLTVRMGRADAAAGAVVAFALLGFTGFAPRLFSRQDIGSSTAQATRAPVSVSPWNIMIGAITIAVLIAIIWLFTILLGLPADNSLMYAVATTLLIVLPVMVAGMFVIGIWYLMTRHGVSRPRTGVIDRSTMRYGLYADTDMDERDRAIRQRAIRAGFGAFFGTYLSLFIGTFITMLIEGKEALTIDIQFLLVPIWLPFIVIVAVSSAATIIMYRRGVRHDET